MTNDKQQIMNEIERLKVQIDINQDLMEVVNSKEEYDRLSNEIVEYSRKINFLKTLEL